MRAVAVYPGARAVRLVDDHPEPAITRANQVLVGMLEVGVCGTDREIAAFSYGTPPPGSPRLVIGHEGLGEVLEVGAEVDGLARGDLVVPMVRRPCPHETCQPCRQGRQDFCETGEYTERGIIGADGMMTERIVDDARYLVPVPAALRDVGVLTEPLTVAEKALRQIRDIQGRLPWMGEADGGAPPRALVLGAGPVGLLGAMLLALAGFEVVVYSRNPAGSERARLVEAFGAGYLSARDHEPEGLPRVAGHFDAVYEATGASGLAFRVLSVLEPNAVFVFTGIPGRRHRVELDTSRIMRDLVLRNQVLLGTVNAGRDAYDAAVRDLARFREAWPGALEQLVTTRAGMADYEGLLAERHGIKQVVRVRRPA